MVICTFCVFSRRMDKAGTHLANGKCAPQAGVTAALVTGGGCDFKGLCPWQEQKALSCKSPHQESQGHSNGAWIWVPSLGHKYRGWWRAPREPAGGQPSGTGRSIRQGGTTKSVPVITEDVSPSSSQRERWFLINHQATKAQPVSQT